MRVASYCRPDGRASYGLVAGEALIDFGGVPGAPASVLDALRGEGLPHLAQLAEGRAPSLALADVELLPPVVAPEKILCVGVNYRNRNAEYKDDSDAPNHPSLFVRFPGSFVGHGQPLIRPRASAQLDYEGEIVLVIGKEGRHVPHERGLDIVAGMTLANEGSIRDWIRHGKFNVTQGKNFDRTGSIGPWLVPLDAIDLSSPLHLTTTVNGETRQDDTTANMIFDFGRLIEYITTFTTLKPGDTILTGTPVGAGARFDPPRWLTPGDMIEVNVPGIGSLINGVADEP